jgi:hypothetical protein
LSLGFLLLPFSFESLSFRFVSLYFGIFLGLLGLLRSGGGQVSIVLSPLGFLLSSRRLEFSFISGFLRFLRLSLRPRFILLGTLGGLLG